MKKTEAIQKLGGSISTAAKAIGISYQAVAKWPDNLPPRIEDRVIAAIARLQVPVASVEKATVGELRHG